MPSWILTDDGAFRLVLDADIGLTLLSDMSTAKVLGRGTAGAGSPEELTLSSDYGLTFTYTANSLKINTPQDLQAAASPNFVTVKCSALTTGYVPYHVDDATGLANSPIFTDGTSFGVGTAVPADLFHLKASVAAYSGFRAENTHADGMTYVYLKNDTGGGAYLVMGGSGTPSVGILAGRAGLYGDSLTEGFSFVASKSTGDIKFYTGGNTAAYERMVINNTGIGIATTLLGAGVTYQKLNVNGSQLFVGADTTQESPMFQVVPSYVVNTHASYTSRTILSQWAIGGAQEVIRFESGAAAKIGFLGAGAVIRQTGDILAGLNNLGLFSSASLAQAQVTGLVITDGPTFDHLHLTSGQIGFPAVQVASADVNTLDDYEEGTWTPGVSFGGASVGITYSVQSGVYVKIGALVFISGRFVMTNKGSSVGAALITGLPFSAQSAGGSIGYFANISFANIPILNPNGATIILYETTEAGAITALADTDFTNSSYITFSATYRIA